MDIFIIFPCVWFIIFTSPEPPTKEINLKYKRKVFLPSYYHSLHATATLKITKDLKSNDKMLIEFIDSKKVDKRG